MSDSTHHGTTHSFDKWKTALNFNTTEVIIELADEKNKIERVVLLNAHSTD